MSTTRAVVDDVVDSAGIVGVSAVVDSDADGSDVVAIDSDVTERASEVPEGVSSDDIRDPFPDDSSSTSSTVAGKEPSEASTMDAAAEAVWLTTSLNFLGVARTAVALSAGALVVSGAETSTEREVVGS